MRDIGTADEADGLDVRVRQDGVDRFLIALHDLEDTRRQPRLEKEFGQSHRNRGVALGRFEDERISARQRWTGFPERDHRGEVERRDACDDSQWLADRVHVDSGAGTLGELALEQMRDPDGELDDLDAALNIAERVRNGLAVLDGQQFGEFV